MNVTSVRGCVVIVSQCSETTTGTSPAVLHPTSWDSRFTFVCSSSTSDSIRRGSIGIHTRRTDGAYLPPLRTGAIGIPSGATNHSRSMPWRAGASATKMRARPVRGTIVVATRGYLGSIGARRRCGHRGHSLAPAHARKVVARSPAHRHEGARPGRLVPGSMLSEIHHCGTTEHPP